MPSDVVECLEMPSWHMTCQAYKVVLWNLWLGIALSASITVIYSIVLSRTFKRLPDDPNNNRIQQKGVSNMALGYLVTGMAMMISNSCTFKYMNIDTYVGLYFAHESHFIDQYFIMTALIFSGIATIARGTTDIFFTFAYLQAF
jgi:hypothetical protein